MSIFDHNSFRPCNYLTYIIHHMTSEKVSHLSGICGFFKMIVTKYRKRKYVSVFLSSVVIGNIFVEIILSICLIIWDGKCQIFRNQKKYYQSISNTVLSIIIVRMTKCIFQNITLKYKFLVNQKYSLYICKYIFLCI